MAKRIDTWECSFCNSRFDFENDAISCEAEHVEAVNRSRLLGLMQKYFPFKHQLDTPCEKHCVDCGRMVIQWEREFDGIERRRTKIQHVENHKEILHGRRCEQCATVFTDRILNALEAYDQKEEELKKP